jgi:ankyrin repeat protein
MIQPIELKKELPMALSNSVLSTTTKVWEILVASRNGDLATVKQLVDECPELIYAQYNYTPPIHFAVREGHIELVSYLLEHGAYDPSYKIYPFQESLVTIAEDRAYSDIALLLEQYASNYSLHKFKGDNGEIFYNRTAEQKEFEEAVDKEDIGRVDEILKTHPEFALDNTFFWGEGILMMPAKENNRELIKLLMSYGAKVPDILKWAQAYYFEDYNAAVFLIENGMSPNVMGWHHVTLLHDMAQKGFIEKAELLVKHGADINAVDEEYQSTPLGMASKWGHAEMVEYLLGQGADPNKSGASWSTPIAWARKKGHEDIEKILFKAGGR